MSLFKSVAGKRFAVTTGLLIPLLFQNCGTLGGESGGKPPQTKTKGWFAISSPTNGHRLNLDSTYRVVWTPSDSAIGGNVRISLYQEEKFIVNLSTSAANNGSYSWNLPTTRSQSGYKFGTGSNYRLKIANSVDSIKWDFSQFFKVYSNYSGSLSLIAPTENTQVILDSALAIRWTSTGSPGSSVGILLFKDIISVATISPSVSNSGFYAWPRVTKTLKPASDYRIRVISNSDPSISGLSLPFRISSSFNGGFQISKPGSGDTLLAGASTKIVWHVSGNPGVYASLNLYRDSIHVRTISSSVLAASDSLVWPIPLGLSTGSGYRIKITSQSDTGVSSFSVAFFVKGSTPDGYENDDSLALAKPIVLDGKPQQHTTVSQDKDYMRFTTEAGKRYLVSLNGATSVTGSVLDSAGNSLNLIKIGTNFQLILNPKYVGKHHFLVTAGSTFGPYAVAIMEYDSTKSTFEVAFSIPDAKTTWATGSANSITWKPDSLYFGTQVGLALYSDTTLVQLISASASNSGTFTWSLPISLVTSSKYRIRITRFGSASIFAYSPSFTINGLNLDTYEPDNSKTDAKVLPADGVAQLHNLVTGDQDWIRINAAAGKNYVAKVNGTASVYGYLLDSSGTQLSSQTGSQYTLILSPKQTGAYYIRFQPGSIGNYSVSLVAFDSANFGFPATFASPAAGDLWASGSAHTVTWTPDNAIFGSNVKLSLYRDSIFIQTLTSLISNSGTFSWTVPSGLATSNKYHIRIQNYSNSQVYGYGPVFTISGVAPDIYEPDDTRGMAKAILTDGSLQLHNLTANDTDWVKIDAAANKTYIINLAATPALYLELTDSLGVLLSSKSGTKVTSLLNPSKAGMYYAKVRNIGVTGTTGTYTLSVASYDGGSSGLAVKFVAPDPTTTWIAGSANTARWTPDTALFGTLVGLGLYQDTVLVQSFGSSVANSGSYSVSIPTGLGTAKIYRIRITNSSNTQIFGYSPIFTITGIAPDSSEPNDSATAAKAVTPNDAKRQLNLCFRDKDWFQFSAKANKLYLIQATSGASVPTNVRLYSGLGTALLQTGVKMSGDSVNGVSWVCPSDGNYSAVVEQQSPSTSNVGNYGFEIKEVDPTSYRFNVTDPAEKYSGKLNQTLSIQWTDPAGVRGMVDIFLYNADGVVQTIIVSQNNSGSYSWRVPATLAARADYYVKVTSKLSSVISGNSGNFSIGP